MQPSTERIVKSALLIFGSFAFARTLSLTIHECGHVLLMWAAGGSVSSLVIHPFSQSFAVGTSPFTAATLSAGMVLDAVLPLLVIVMIGHVRTPYWLPLIMTAIIGLGMEGAYLLFDTLALNGGDPTELVRLGISRPLLLSIGVAMVCASVAIMGIFSPLSGIRRDDPIRSRIIILEAGVLPYACIGIVFRTLFVPEGAMIWIEYAVFGSLAILFVGAVSRSVQHHVHFFRIIDNPSIEWNHVAVAMILGILAIIAPLLLLSLK